jgi:hypothetical protein
MPKINKNANILSLIDNTPSSLMKAVAANVRSRRLGRNWTQKLLAARPECRSLLTDFLNQKEKYLAQSCNVVYYFR